MNLKPLSDQALLESARSAAKVERESTTTVLHHLMEVESRRLFVTLGHPSLFEYVVADLHYSAPAAQRRIDAMRLLKVLPEVQEKVESGVLTLSALSQAQRFFRQEAKIEKALKPDQKREVLQSLENKSTREVDRELISRATEPLNLKKDSIRAVSETHSELKFLATQETLDQLERIRGLLGHKHHDLSLGELVAIMAKITLEKLDPAREPLRKRTRAAATATPTAAARKPDTQGSRSVPAPEPSEASRYIPSPVRREVWKQANGKCSNCGSLYRLQMDHIQPFALRGSSQIEKQTNPPPPVPRPGRWYRRAERELGAPSTRGGRGQDGREPDRTNQEGR